VFKASPIKKCPGVSTLKSDGSLEKAQSGREFRTHSICTKRTEFLVREESVPDNSPKMMFGRFHRGFPLAAEVRSARRVETPFTVFGRSWTAELAKFLGCGAEQPFQFLVGPDKVRSTVTV